MLAFQNLWESVVKLYETTMHFYADPRHEVFAIGDVHGCLNPLQDILQEIASAPRNPEKQSILVFLGDLIDRGPQSLGCIDAAIRAKTTARVDQVVFLRGNHEQMLSLALQSVPPEAERIDLASLSRNEKSALLCWLDNGGDKVLKDSKLDSFPALLGRTRRTWLDRTEPAFFSGSIAFVHAGFSPRISLAEIRAIPHDLPIGEIKGDTHWAWVRNPFLRHTTDESGHHGYFVCHGHTPPAYDPIPSFQGQIARHRINLDGGSFLTGRIRYAHFNDNRVIVYEGN
jgi:serine/threonine protein phosphatase 1